MNLPLNPVSRLSHGQGSNSVLGKRFGLCLTRYARWALCLCCKWTSSVAVSGVATTIKLQGCVPSICCLNLETLWNKHNCYICWLTRYLSKGNSGTAENKENYLRLFWQKHASHYFSVCISTQRSQQRAATICQSNIQTKADAGALIVSTTLSLVKSRKTLVVIGAYASMLVGAAGGSISHRFRYIACKAQLLISENK